MNVTTDESFVATWLEANGKNELVALATRHALRVLPMVGPVIVKMADLKAPEKLPAHAALSVLRACLTASVACKDTEIDLEQKLNQSNTRLRIYSEEFGRYESRLRREKSKRESRLPALAPVNQILKLPSMLQPTLPTKQSAKAWLSLYDASANDYGSELIRCAKSDTHEIEDSQHYADVFDAALWPGPGMPRALVGDLEKLQEFFRNAPDVWGFWKRWYDGFLYGAPHDWEIQLAVAKIPETDWLEGPEFVAKRIAEIEANHHNTQYLSERSPNFEPANVQHVLLNRTIFSYQTSETAATVAQAVEAFHSGTGQNHLPEPFASLPQISQSFSTVSAILQSRSTVAETEQILREEIGRLNARIAQLESDLSAAIAANQLGLPEAKLKEASRSLANPGLYVSIIGGVSALLGALWVVSGDEIGPERRLEMLKSYCAVISSKCDVDAPIAAPRRDDGPTVDA